MPNRLPSLLIPAIYPAFQPNPPIMKKLLLLAVLLFPLLATAQVEVTGTLASPAPVRPDIEELLSVMRAQKLSESMMAQMKNAMGGFANKGALSPEAAARMKAGQDKAWAFISEELKWDNMKPEYARIYADVFTPEEIKSVTAFYKSPAGQAFLDKQPTLIQRTMEMTQKKIAGLMPRMMEEMRNSAGTPTAPKAASVP